MAKKESTVNGQQFEGVTDKALAAMHRGKLDEQRSIEADRRAIKDEIARRNPPKNAPSAVTATATVTHPPDAIKKVKAEMARAKTKARRDELKAVLDTLQGEAKGK